MSNDDEWGEIAPRDSHWHYTMVKQRVWGLCDIRAALVFPLCLVNLFGWWTSIKIPAIVGTFVVFTLLEMRRITLGIAIRQVLAWLRGVHTPGIATAAQTYFGYRPCPLPPRGIIHRGSGERPKRRAS